MQAYTNTLFMNIRILLLMLFISCGNSFAQQPNYTPKNFVNRLDTAEFKYITPKKNGFSRTFLLTKPSYYDLDDDSTTYIMFSDSAVITVEGNIKNGNREGVYKFYLTDEYDHNKRYKIWEQTFKNDKLDGEWRKYKLRGGLVSTENFKNGILNGISKMYWIDGKTLVEETKYFDDPSFVVLRKYYSNNKLKSTSAFTAGKLNGISKSYYENGNLKEYAEFKNNDFNGVRKYFYENGQLWIEQTYVEGKFLDVIANYTEGGIKRDPGSLKNGTGTIIFYNEDGSVREVQHIINGYLKNSN